MKVEVIAPSNRQTVIWRRIPQGTAVRWTAALLAALAIAAGGWLSMKTVRGPAVPNPAEAALQHDFVTDAAQCASPTPSGGYCPPANTMPPPRISIDEVFMKMSLHSR